MEEVLTGALASGNRYRVTPHIVEITAPDGAVVSRTDTTTLAGVFRDGSTVLLLDVTGESIRLETTSPDDASRVRDMLRYTAPAVPPPDKVSRYRTVWIALAVVAAAAFVIVEVVLPSLRDSTPALSDESSTNAVRLVYEVTEAMSDGAVRLTYTNSFGNTEQLASVPTPWRHTVEIARGESFYVSAQRGPGNVSVSCTVSVDGVVVEQATSRGENVIATCSGRVP